MIESFIFVLEIIGTVAFSISGAMTAIDKKMDILGVIALGLTSAVGGGIIRDVLLGIIPATSFRRPVYAMTAIAVAIIIFLPPIRKNINLNNRTFLIMDSIGLGIFTVIGVRTAISDGGFFFSVFLGAITGVGGGVVRDVFTGEMPIIFVKHFYASASIIGAVACYLLCSVNETAALITGAMIVIILRILAAYYKWHLPKA